MVNVPIEEQLSNKQRMKQKIQNIAMLRDENEILELLINNYKLVKEWQRIQILIAKEKAEEQKKRVKEAEKIIKKAKKENKKIEEAEIRVAPPPRGPEPPTPEPERKGIKSMPSSNAPPFEKAKYSYKEGDETVLPSPDQEKANSMAYEG